MGATVLLSNFMSRNQSNWMLEVFINVILLRKPVIKKRIEYHDALNGKLKKTKKKKKKKS